MPHYPYAAFPCVRHTHTSVSNPSYKNVSLRWNLKTPLLLSTRVVSRELCHGFSTAVEPGNRRISKLNGGYVLIFMPMFVMTLSAVFAKNQNIMNQCRTAWGDGSTELSHTHRHDLLFLCFEMRPLPGTPTAGLHVTLVYCLTLRVAFFLFHRRPAITHKHTHISWLFA